MRERIPTFFSQRDYVTAGGLMSYGTDVADMYRQVGVSQRPQGGQGGRPPVVQPTRFGFVLNLQTTRALGIEVQPTLPAVADEVIE